MVCSFSIRGAVSGSMPEPITHYTGQRAKKRKANHRVCSIWVLPIKGGSFRRVSGEMNVAVAFKRRTPPDEIILVASATTDSEKLITRQILNRR
jgi:hypothetical protein